MFHLKPSLFGALLLMLFVVTVGDLLPQAAPLASGPFVNSDQSLGGETGNGVALGDLDGDGDTDSFVAWN